MRRRHWSELPPSLSGVFYFPYVGALISVFAIYLHLTRLFFDASELVEKIYTPFVEQSLFVPVLFTALAMPIFVRRIAVVSAWRTISYWAIAAFFGMGASSAILSPLGPRWISAALLPWLAFQLYFFLTMTARRPTYSRTRFFAAIWRRV